ncbi:hypothetical protein P9112_005637 [Eukaryota sp. TZLM1-RC]
MSSCCESKEVLDKIALLSPEHADPVPSSPPTRKRIASPGNITSTAPPAQRSRILSPGNSRPNSPNTPRSPAACPSSPTSPSRHPSADGLFIRKRATTPDIGTSEEDPVRLKWRQRQIQFGKSTEGYKRYIEQIPFNQREDHHPKTPPIDLKISKKKWGYLCNSWRRELHKYDVPVTSEGKSVNSD